MSCSRPDRAVPAGLADLASDRRALDPRACAKEFDEMAKNLPNRRQILKAAGAAALAGLGSGLRGTALAQQCSVVAAPSLTEGPYFVDEILHRSDIRVDPTDNSIQEGFPLTL